VGALWPTNTRQINISTGLALPSKEGLLVADFSNWGTDLIWAPGDEIYVSEAGNASNTAQYLGPNAKFLGTSAAAPFVTGVVALLKSRNPGLTPSQIKQILKEASASGLEAGAPANNSVYKKSQFPASMAPVRMLDVSAALQHSLVSTSSRKAETFFGLVENGKVLKLNKSVQGGSNPAPANEEKSKTLLETIGETVWKTNLASDNLVKVKGWSDIKAGDRQIAKTEIEVMDGIQICNANDCSDPGAFKPQLTKVTYSANPEAKNGFELELEGQNLVADIRTGTNVMPIKLVFKHVKSTAPTPVTPLPGDKPVDISANQILDIRNDGTYVKLKVDPNQVSASFDYQIAFQSGITGVGNFASNYVQTGGGAARADFSVKAEGGGSTGSFTIQSISTTPPPSPPPAVGVWITRDGQRKAVNPSQLIGIGITGLDLSGIEIVVDNKVMPIQQVAANYVTFGLTPTLAPGVKDMLIKLAGNTVTLPEAIEVLAMPPLQETQTLPTVGALQPAPFQINGEHFLAIPNYFNGQSYHLNSQIYKWNGTQFSLVQTIPTFGAYDLHPFSVGDQHFLAIANFDQNVYAANSEIYKWNGSQFVPFQTIPTTGGIDWESFSIDNRHFLALATHYNGSFERESLIYEWKGTQFVLFQSLPTRGAHKWTHFLTIGTERFLALTTYFYVGSGTEDTQSELYKWNGSQFVFNQTFNTDFDLDFDTFTINGQLFAAIINNSRISNTVDSKILKWNGSQFVDFQNIPTTGGLNWDYFTVKGWHYLLLTTNTTLPQIYRWNGADFELYRVLAMDKAWGSALFSTGPLENYLVLGSLIGPQGYSSPSRVFRFD
jgi:hypothetical protein